MGGSKEGSAVAYIWFLVRSLVGLFFSLIIFGAIFFSAAFSGEVFHPLLIPYIGVMCIILMAIPLAFLQSRVALSEKARRIIPAAYGLFWLPLTFAASSFLPPHSNVWVSGLRGGLLGGLISFIVTLLCVKLGDLFYQSRKTGQAE